MGKFGNRERDGNDMNLVTVVLLTYNHRETFARAMESILAQQTDFAFDIHILDDHSTDGTSELCREFAQRYPGRVKHFCSPVNLGVAKNLKRGLLNVSARYFAFLEGDDYWTDPSKLQRQVDAMEAHPQCTLCGHNVLLRDLTSGEERAFVKREPGDQREIYALDDDLPIHPSARLYRNTVDLHDLPEHMVLDTHIYLIYLMEGDLFYIDRLMSVYNKTGAGYWSGMDRKRKRLMTLELRYKSLVYLRFRHEERFYRRSALLKCCKSLLGVSRGWRLFYLLESARLRLKFLLS